MAISKTPKRASEPQKEVDPIFGEPIAQVFEDLDAPGGNEDDDSKKNEDQEKFERLEKLYNELKTEREDDLNYLRTADGKSQVEKEPEYIDPNTVKLPDAALEADAFAAAVERRAEIKMENARRKEAWEKKQQQKLDDDLASLWDAYSDAFPDHAANKKRVEYIANDLAQEAAKSGKDVQKYMFVTRNKFMRDLTERYEETFGEPEPIEAGNEDIDDDPPVRNSRRRSGNRNRAAEDNGRSTGIFGSRNGGGGGGKKPKDEGDDGSNMIDDLQKAQRASGFF
jgi:hypothetical protein